MTGLESQRPCRPTASASNSILPPASSRAWMRSLPIEPQLDAVVYRPLPGHPVADAYLCEQVHRALLEHPCPDLRLQPLAAAGLYYHRLDALQMQEMREYQARRPAPNDP